MITPIREMHGNKLTWGCRKRTDISELRSQDCETLYGMLCIEKKTGWFWPFLPYSPPAVAESADGCFRFVSCGFWGNKVKVGATDSGTAVAFFDGKRLELSNGHKFLWHWIELVNVPGYWSAVGEFTDEQGGCLLHCDVEVTIEPAARLIPELSLMVLLGDYLRYQGLLALERT